MRQLLFIIGALLALPVFSQNIAGDWNGITDINGTKLRLVFHIKKENNVYNATIDSPDQGAKGIPVSNIEFDNERLLIEIKNIDFKYTGVLKEDSVIEGSFTQMNATFPLNLKRGEVKINRPQEPSPPYPYISEEVKFENKEAGIKLAGTLTYPKDGTKHPAVVLITGSGSQNRDEELMNHKPFWILADYLTRNGIAVLRFDDRGFAQSEGNFAESTTEDFASDAYSAVRYLKARKEIDPKNIGLIGHSEGGMIAFMLGAKHKDIAYLISMAGSAIKGDSLMIRQARKLVLTSGVSEEIAEQNAQTIKRIQEEINKHSRDFIKMNLDSLIGIVLPQEDNWSNSDMMKRNIANSFYQWTSPWGYYFMNYDPMCDIRKISCPVFAINGEKDVQVEADIHMPNIEKGLKEAGNKRYTLKIYPDLNHLFQHCETGAMSEYATIEETMSEEVPEDIAKWIKEIIR